MGEINIPLLAILVDYDIFVKIKKKDFFCKYYFYKYYFIKLNIDIITIYMSLLLTYMKVFYWSMYAWVLEPKDVQDSIEFSYFSIKAFVFYF